MTIRRDKLLHFETCALVCIILAHLLPLWAAGVAAVALGIVKEAWDKHHGGVASWSDFAADCAGAAAGIIIGLI